MHADEDDEDVVIVAAANNDDDDDDDKVELLKFVFVEGKFSFSVIISLSNICGTTDNEGEHLVAVSVFL